MRGGRVSSARCPALALVEEALQRHDALTRALQFFGRPSAQPVTAESICRALRHHVLEYAAQELAEDQGVEDGSARLASGGRVSLGFVGDQAVAAGAEVLLVGTRAIVIRTAGADRETQTHRLEGAWLVAGQLEALHVHGEARRRGITRSRPRARREPSASKVPSVLASQSPDLFQQAQGAFGITEGRSVRQQAVLCGSPSRRPACLPALITSTPSASQRSARARMLVAILDPEHAAPERRCPRTPAAPACRPCS